MVYFKGSMLGCWPRLFNEFAKTSFNKKLDQVCASASQMMLMFKFCAADTFFVRKQKQRVMNFIAKVVPGYKYFKV